MGSLESVSSFPKISLLETPSAIVPLDRLSKALGGPRIWIKRDDVSPLIGGNKLRKLEYLLGDALAKNADTIIALGALQSNHARISAAAAIQCGLTCHLILKDEVRWPSTAYQRSGNRLLETLMGCEVDVARPDEAILDVVERRRAALESSGRRPYVIPFGGSNGLGNLGYVDCALEIERQQTGGGSGAFTHIFLGSGSGGTQAGLVAAQAFGNLSARVIGVTVLRDRDSQEKVVLEQALQTCALLGGATTGLIEAAIECDDSHYLPGYGWPNEGVREAIELCARLEGLLLDPVYTGKAMAGLIRWVRAGKLRASDVPLFIHTGGLPGLFAYEDYFTNKIGFVTRVNSAPAIASAHRIS
jgi:D-cysteine desulfhydrase/L-cysteate sulfo-lyase